MLSAVDYSLIGAYLLFALGVAFAVRKAASQGIESFFVAGRSLPWWWLGTSMVATTFASDTPLVVTGFVAKHGIAGNWFWWTTAVGLVLLGVLFARNWRRSEVVTDAEFSEMRYDGSGATFLRGFKAFFGSVFVNCIVLGWVFAAMGKIGSEFLHWESYLGTSGYESLEAAWPSFLTYRESLNDTLTVLVLVFLVMIYSSVGGLRGVVATDLLQFGIALLAAVLFAVYAVDHVGGLGQLWIKLDAIYPEGGSGPSASEIIAFWPSLGEGALMSFGAFAAGLGVLWWANSQIDGSGYLTQRVLSASTERDAEWGALWFVFANFVLRTWPWVLVGLVALVVYPLGAPDALQDREAAYPMLMTKVLPPGVLGLVLLSLIAAFMSTVDTHLNWGASYLSNDLYRRFYHPRADEKELVWVGRGSVVLLTILALLVAGQINQVGDMWKFYMAMMSGLGIPHVLRWVWWRANAWTEIAGIFTGLALSFPAYFFGWADDFAAEYVIATIASLSSLVAIGVTLATPPVAEEKLRSFSEKIRPVGAWKDFSSAPRGELNARLRAWGFGVVGVYATMLGLGLLLRFEWLSGIATLAAGLGASALTLRALKQAEPI